MRHPRSNPPRRQPQDLPERRTRLYGQLLLVALLLFPSPMWAAPFTASNETELIDAINDANDEGTYPGPDTITLTADIEVTAADNGDAGGDNGLPLITSEITVTSDIANGRIIFRDTANASTFRFFEVSSTGDLTLDNVTLTGGDTATGGAARNSGGILTLTNTTVSDNVAGSGGGLYNYTGTTTVEQGSAVLGNTAVYGGGLYVLYGTAALTDSTVADNSSGYSGGGIGGLYSNGSVSLTNSTVSGNTTDGVGGGIYVGYNSAATLTNSTVSGNTAAGRGGGVFGWFTSEVGLVNSTLSGNSAGVAGGGVYVDDFGEGLVAGSPDKIAYTSVTLANTLVANSAPQNCAGNQVNVIDSGNNLADDATCGAGFAALTGLDPVLADNGGPTLTHALLCGSSAIDWAGDCGLATDQRGLPRDDGLCDSGSYELQAGDDPGDLYPIALSTAIVDPASPPASGTLIPDIYNGVEPGNFGWLTWTGDPSVPVLAASLTPPGDSDTYVNPYDPADQVVSIGDWVQGSPGVSNASDIRAMLDGLIEGEIVITVPIWDMTESSGNNSNYRVAGFAKVVIAEYMLPRDNMISAIFIDLVDPGCP